MHTLQQMIGRIAISVKKRTKMLTILGAGLVIGSLGSTIVSAAIPDAAGVIRACYTNSASIFNAKGTLQVIDTATTPTCPNGTTAISWDQHGSTGSADKGGFISANLPNSHFRLASLQYRDLTNMTLTSSLWEGSDFTGSDLTGSNFSNSAFKLADSTTNYSSLAAVTATGTNFSGSSFEFLRAPGANFSNANFTNTTFDGSTFGAGTVPTDFTGTNFQNADFTGAHFILGNGGDPSMNQFQGGIFSGAQFKNATLAGITFTGSNFTGAIWNNTICPDGTNSNSHGNTCIGFGL